MKVCDDRNDELASKDMVCQIFLSTNEFCN